MLKSYHSTYNCVFRATHNSISLERAIESGNQKYSPLFPCGKNVATETVKRHVVQYILLKMSTECFSCKQTDNSVESCTGHAVASDGRSAAVLQLKCLSFVFQSSHRSGGSKPGAEQSRPRE